LLSEALNKYEGSYILVSHDRYFISKTANKIWEIVDHEIKEFKGGYEEYVQWKERMAKSNVESLKSNVESSKPEIKSGQPPTLNVKHSTLNNTNREQQKELQKLQKQFSKLEGSLNELNQQKTNIEADLANPEYYADKNKFLELEERYKSVQKKIAAANQDYEQLFEKIMQLESEA